MLRKGAQANSRDAAGKTMLMLSCEAGTPEVVDLLRRQKGDITAVHKEHANLTCLHYAASSGDLETLAILAKDHRFGEIVNKLDVNSRTALFYTDSPDMVSTDQMIA